MRNKYEANHVLYRDGIYYYVRRVPYDLTSHYDVKRLCFSLKTKSASAAINKWLKPRVPDGCVIHSFRHSLRDRLREVECPSDVVDAIGGWSTEGVGQGYGKGYGLELKARWMQRIV